MKRISYILFFCFFTITANAINEVEAKKVVINYYNLLTEVSQSSDKNRGARDKFGSMFIHAEGWIFNDIEYKINGRKKEDDRIDTYIMSMAGNGLFNAKFTPSNIITTRKGNEWQISYDIDVYKQNRTIYTIPLLMHLNSAGKIRYIGKYKKVELTPSKFPEKCQNIKIEYPILFYSKQGVDGSTSKMYQNYAFIAKAGEVANVHLVAYLEADKNYGNVKFYETIEKPDGTMIDLCPHCVNDKEGRYTSAPIWEINEGSTLISGFRLGNPQDFTMEGVYIYQFWSADKQLLFSTSFLVSNVCPLELSDSIIEVDCEYHDINIVVKSESEWDVKLNKNWNKDGERLNNGWCDWRVLKLNDSILSIRMTHNLRTSAYSDYVTIKSGECEREIKLTQSGYKLHKATINDCYIEKNKKGQYIVHVDFDAYNNEIKGDTHFYVVVCILNDSQIIWKNQTDYSIPSRKHLHQNLKVEIPYYYNDYKKTSVEIGIWDSYGNELEKKTITIVNK